MVWWNPLYIVPDGQRRLENRLRSQSARFFLVATGLAIHLSSNSKSQLFKTPQQKQAHSASGHTLHLFFSGGSPLIFGGPKRVHFVLAGPRAKRARKAGSREVTSFLGLFCHARPRSDGLRPQWQPPRDVLLHHQGSWAPLFLTPRVWAQNETIGANRRFWSMCPLTRVPFRNSVFLSHGHTSWQLFSNLG